MKPKPTIEKRWTHNGLECVVARMTIGHLCGYVRTPAEHPWCGVHYWEDLRSGPKLETRDDWKTYPSWTQWYEATKATELDDQLQFQLEVHGGVTFSGQLSASDLDGWWLGFDTAHLDDEYRGWCVESVARETERLADQIATRAAVGVGA